MVSMEKMGVRRTKADGCITPEYVQRAWGGRVAIEDINAAFEELKRSNNLLFIVK